MCREPLARMLRENRLVRERLFLIPFACIAVLAQIRIRNTRVALLRHTIVWIGHTFFYRQKNNIFHRIIFRRRIGYRRKTDNSVMNIKNISRYEKDIFLLLKMIRWHILFFQLKHLSHTAKYFSCTLHYYYQSNDDDLLHVYWRFRSRPQLYWCYKSEFLFRYLFLIHAF